MIKKIVYSSENGGYYTKEDVMSEIDLWISETEEFQSLTASQVEKLKEVTYEVLMGLLEWTTPYTKLAQFDEEDIEELVERVVS